MRVFYNLDNLPLFTNAAVTIGSFDGVHCGHQKIIQQLKAEAAQTEGETVVVTFFPHPRKVIHRSSEPLQLLTTLKEKLELLERNGVDNVVVVPFSKAFAAQPAEVYIEDFLMKKIHPKTIIIGHDHKFGKDRCGDYHTLERYGARLGFEVKEIPAEVLHEITISSTQIRNCLLSGKIEEANELLGYAYFLNGSVVHGDEIGRTIGYPTANLLVDDADKLVPGNGVYTVHVRHQNMELGGMLGIGMRPTVNGKFRTIETNIFDFDKDIYGDELRIVLIARLRDEEKFDSLELMRMKIADDEIRSRKILSAFVTV